MHEDDEVFFYPATRAVMYDVQFIQRPWLILVVPVAWLQVLKIHYGNIFYQRNQSSSGFGTCSEACIIWF